MEQTHQEAAAAHKLARQRMAGRIKGMFDHFEIGQKVWLEAKNLNTGYNKKISTKQEGPFRISEKLGPVNYWLELPPTWTITNNFHAILLSSYRENEIHRPNFPQPVSNLINNKPEWEVERILKHCKMGRSKNYKYLVLWKEYPITKVFWEPEENLKHAKDILAQYKRDKNIKEINHIKALWARPEDKTSFLSPSSWNDPSDSETDDLTPISLHWDDSSNTDTDSYVVTSEDERKHLLHMEAAAQMYSKFFIEKRAHYPPIETLA